MGRCLFTGKRTNHTYQLDDEEIYVCSDISYLLNCIDKQDDYDEKLRLYKEFIGLQKFVDPENADYVKQFNQKLLKSIQNLEKERELESRLIVQETQRQLQLEDENECGDDLVTEIENYKRSFKSLGIVLTIFLTPIFSLLYCIARFPEHTAARITFMNGVNKGLKILCIIILLVVIITIVVTLTTILI